MALGADNSWCSPENPQSGCTPLKGICKPMTPAALEAFKEFQRQVSRARVALGKTAIGVDGRLGPATVSAAVETSNTMNAQGASPPGQFFDDCNDIAGNVINATVAYKTFADAKGAPAIVQNPTSSPPSIVVGNQVQNPSDKQSTAAASAACKSLSFFDGLMCRFKIMPTWQQAGVGVLAGIAALFVVSKVAPKKTKA